MNDAIFVRRIESIRVGKIYHFILHYAIIYTTKPGRRESACSWQIWDLFECRPTPFLNDGTLHILRKYKTENSTKIEEDLEVRLRSSSQQPPVN